MSVMKQLCVPSHQSGKPGMSSSLAQIHRNLHTDNKKSTSHIFDLAALNFGFLKPAHTSLDLG